LQLAHIFSRRQHRIVPNQLLTIRVIPGINKHVDVKLK
jgi:hypothetical protein